MHMYIDDISSINYKVFDNKVNLIHNSYKYI